jgi:hemerythrin-like domain-containing protein
MKMTDALLGEHGVFYAIFDYLEEILRAVETADEVRRLAALLAAALVPHAAMENEHLFAALERHTGLAGPLAVMRGEHDEIEGVLASLDDTDDPDELKGRILGAIRLAREHFRKEETVLFPMTESRLGVEVLGRLGKIWAEQRGVAVGS